MTEAIALRPEVALSSFTKEQADLIKRTCTPADVTDDEFRLFLHVARVSGLDPLRRQIHCTKRQGRLTIIAGIDGLQARAARESDYKGIVHGVVCEKDDFAFDAQSGAVRHVVNPFGQRGAIVGAYGIVHRDGKLPFAQMVRFAEYVQPQSPTWKQMPHVMIDKVARSTALRMAYPEQFSSIYEPAEMDQADVPATVNGAATEALKSKLLAAVSNDVPMPAPAQQVVEARPSRMQIQTEEPPPPSDEDAPPEEDGPPAAVLVPFGNKRGTPVSDLSDRDLAWYAAANLTAKNPEFQAAVADEISRRKQ